MITQKDHALKKPDSLAFKWWKTNKPASLPRGKIDKALQSHEKFKLKVACKNFKKWGQAEIENHWYGNPKGKKPVEPKEFTELGVSYTTILAELKVFKNIATKAKEKEFADNIDLLIKIARKENNEYLTYGTRTRDWITAKKKEIDATRQRMEDKKAEEDGGDLEPSEKKKYAKIRAAIQRYYGLMVKDMRNAEKIIKNIAVKSGKSVDEQGFATCLGENKYVAAWVKAKTAEIKKQDVQFLKDIKKLGGTKKEAQKRYDQLKAGQLAKKRLQEYKDLGQLCKKADAVIVKNTAKALEKKTAMRLYANASPVKVPLG
jgi:hypothetical protein